MIECLSCRNWGKGCHYDRDTGKLTYIEPCESCYDGKKHQNFVPVVTTKMYKIKKMDKDSLVKELTVVCELFGNCKNKEELIKAYLEQEE